MSIFELLEWSWKWSFWHFHPSRTWRGKTADTRVHRSLVWITYFLLFLFEWSVRKISCMLQMVSKTVWHYKIIRKRSNWSYSILFLFDLLLCCFTNLVFLGLLGEKVIGGASIYFWARKTFLLRGLRLYVEFRRYESGELNERHFSTQRSHWLSDRHREREQ